MISGRRVSRLLVSTGWMRVVTFGSGGLMSTVTLIGATPAELDAIDFAATLRAAAENYLAITDPKG